MEARLAVGQAIRRRLTRNASLSGMVGSNHITITADQQVATFPCIRYRVVGAEGRNLRSFLDGDIYMNIYTNDKQPAVQLASIYKVVASLIINQQNAMTTTNFAFSKIWESNCDYPLTDPKTNLTFLSVRFGYVGQAK